jgi:hypothetical protein
MIVVINQLHKYLLGELNVKWCKHITRPARDIFVFVNLQTFGSTLKGKYWLCFHQGRRQTWYLLQYPGLWHSWLHFLHRGWWFLVVWALAWALTMIMSSVFRLVVNISASCTGSRGQGSSWSQSRALKAHWTCRNREDLLENQSLLFLPLDFSEVLGLTKE